MSKEFEKKIEELFLHKEKILSNESLESIIHNFLKEETVKETKIDVPQVSYSDIFKILPKFEFREAQVGGLNTKVKEQFRDFFSETLKNQTTLEAKVKYLESFTTFQETITATDEILSNLMILKVLENIIRQSSPGAGGFQMEALLASLFATGKQIRTNVQTKAVDIDIHGITHQVKLVDKTRSVRMSIRTILNYFKTNNELNFIIIEKENVEGIYIFKYVLEKADFDKKLKLMNKKLSSSLNKKILTAEDEIENYTIKKEDYKNGFIGAISIQKQVFDMYSEVLEKNVKSILVSTADLINNINRFYIKNDVNAADAGRTNAIFISKNLKK